MALRLRTLQSFGRNSHSYQTDRATLESPIKPDSEVPGLLKDDIRKFPDLNNTSGGVVKTGQQGEDIVLKKVRYSTKKIQSAVASRLPGQEGL